MKEHKEGVYIIWNMWMRKSEKNEIWPHSKLDVHKIMNMVHLQNAGLLTE